MCWGEPFTIGIEEFAGEHFAVECDVRYSVSLIVFFEARCDLGSTTLAGRLRRVAGIRRSAMDDLSDVDSVVQKMIEGPPRVRGTP